MKIQKETIAALALLVMTLLFAGLVSAAEPITLNVVHSPVAPTTASTVKITATASGGAVSDVKVYIDNVYIPTTASCNEPLECMYVAQKTGLSAGMHSYYATAQAGSNGLIQSSTKYFTVSSQVPTLVVVHVPGNPKAGENVTIVAIPQNGGLFGGAIYFDGAVIPTEEFCTTGSSPVCGFKAVKTNLEAGAHKYNATGIFGNTIIASVTKTMNVAPGSNDIVIEYFKAVPSTIAVGESSALLWSVKNAGSVSIDNGIGPVDKEGSIAVKPNKTTVYTITASLGGTTNQFAAGKVVQKKVTVYVKGSVTPDLSVAFTPGKPTDNDKITFIASSTRKLTNVKIYVDGKGLKTTEDCEKPVISSNSVSISNDAIVCRYYATTQLKEGKHSYYAQGQYGRKKITTARASFEVTSAGSSAIELTLSPQSPTDSDKITFTAKASGNNFKDLTIYLDGRALKTKAQCTRSVKGDCTYTASAGPLKVGKHNVQAKGKYKNSRVNSAVVTFAVSDHEKIAMYHFPHDPVEGDGITLNAMPFVKVSDLQIYFDNEQLKTYYNCAQPQVAADSAQNSWYNDSNGGDTDKLAACKYYAVVDDVSSGRHRYYAVASTPTGDIKSDVYPLKVKSSEINPQN